MEAAAGDVAAVASSTAAAAAAAAASNTNFSGSGGTTRSGCILWTWSPSGTTAVRYQNFPPDAAGESDFQLFQVCLCLLNDLRVDIAVQLWLVLALT